jgi:glycerol-3-phosphate acyltransferase PlsX
MGRESNKGGETLIEAYGRLQKISLINFVGNVEGNELTGGRADVIVCEGLLGNVVLKLLEGLAEALVDLTVVAQRNWRWRAGLAMLSSGVGRLRELTDYASYGGAPILGFEHLFIKAHGRSTAPAISNAVKVAAKAVRDGVPAEIRAAVEQVP